MSIIINQCVIPFPETDAGSYLGTCSGDELNVARSLYQAAIDHIQTACSIQLTDAEGTLRLDEFPEGRCEILICRPPVREVLEFSYLDKDGISVTLPPARYQFDGDSAPARLLPAPRTVWPETLCGGINTVTIRFRCGPDTTGRRSGSWPTPPSAQRLAFYLMAYWFENRLQTGNPPAADPFYEQQLNLLRWI